MYKCSNQGEAVARLQGTGSLLEAEVHLSPLQARRRNTAFFHASASAHLRRNQIKALHSKGRVFTNHGDKERVLHDFYSSMLGATPLGRGIRGSRPCFLPLRASRRWSCHSWRRNSETPYGLCVPTAALDRMGLAGILQELLVHGQRGSDGLLGGVPS
jgi:hypothetical protein